MDLIMTETQRRSLPDKIRLLTRIWVSYLRVVLMSRRPLPDQVRVLQARKVRPSRPVAPQRLGRAIHRGLRVGPIAPRCLPKALVMFEILHEQGAAPELVIGLPMEPRSHEAHAWVELDSVDVGPPPGRSGHDVLARYA
jgi:hypothetical protein